MFGLVTILYIFTMLGNGVCILNEERFLKHIGVSTKSQVAAVKQTADLLRLIKKMLIAPLILVNIVFMLYELLWG